MKLLAIAFALGLLVLVGWFMAQTEKPGPNVGELDGLAVLRLMNGEVTPPDYCVRRGLKGASSAAKDAMQQLADGYYTFAPAARESIKRSFFAVPPARQQEYDLAQKFLGALQKSPGLVTEPTFRAQLVIIVEFLQQQCQQLAAAQAR